MTAGVLTNANWMPARDANGLAVIGRIRVYVDHTTTPLAVYTTSALDVAHSQPIASSDAGVYPAIWIDSANTPVTMTFTQDDGRSATYEGVTSNSAPGVVVLTDGATPALNAALGSMFTLTALGDRTIAVPTNPVSGQIITIRHLASGADRTLALNSGAGGFRFGATISSLSATTSAKTDYITCAYNAADAKWDVIAVVKGY